MDEQPVPTQPLPLKMNGVPINKKSPVFIIVLSIVALIGISFLLKPKKQNQNIIKPAVPVSSLENSFYERDTLKRISSDAEFTELFTSSEISNMRTMSISAGNEMQMKGNTAAPSADSSQTVERTSGTNVQVFGIDEPDIVKSDAASIYYSREGQYTFWRNDRAPRGIELQSMPATKMIAPQYQQTSEIVAVGALPPSAMKMQSSIPLNGEMLISDKVLVVFTYNTEGSLQLEGYSIANPVSPKKLWELPFSNRTQKVGARLYKNIIYLVTSTSPIMPRPCPLPLIEGKTNLKLRCSDVYMPSSRPPSNAVYSVLKIDPKTGSVENTLSVAGQLGQTQLYMSQDALYISYHMNGNSIHILNQFIAENKGVFPKYIEDKMIKLNSYDLSQSTKEIEMNSLLSQYLDSMDSDERLKQENQLNNSFKKFFNKYKRSFEYTGIIKIHNENLSILATGKVPGSTLNQFSFDEWKGDLRVATTIGGQNPFYMLGGDSLIEQISDVYVLGGKLEVKGSVKDLGKTERIYSVRFIEDRGYVVTFRQTDPFYVLDLSNGNSPQLKGELKIPGYSSYLHPLAPHLILGIGREQQVKLSLFDVSDPKAPKEVSKYELAGEYWSEAMDNHHAFLQDDKYHAFFLPGSRGGYVFSYEANTLSLVKALEAPGVKRGLYLNDYLYIVSDSGITSFKEGSWDKVGEFTYEKEVTPIDKVIPPILMEEPPMDTQIDVVEGTAPKP